MDRKSFFILFLSALLLMLWFPLVNYLYPPVPKPTNSVELVTNALPATNPGPVITASTNLPTRALPPVVSDVPEQVMALENEHVRFLITSHGGGIQKVELKQYSDTVACDRRSRELAPRPASLNGSVPIPVMMISGLEALDRDALFTLTSTGKMVRAEKQLGPDVLLIKEFLVESNFLLRATVRIENRGAQPLQLPPLEYTFGTATPLGEEDDGRQMGAFWFNGKKTAHITEGWFENRTLGCFAGTPRSEYRKTESTNVQWAAVHNRFFSLAILPSAPASEIVFRHIPLLTNANSPKPKANFGHQGSLVYPAIAVPPGQALDLQFHLYAGPREYHTLARIGDRFKNNLDAVMDFGFFGWFAKALLLSMNALHSKGLSYGVAIIVITLIIKSLFWPLTAASTRSMKRLAELQPQIKAIQEKYKDDPQKKNVKTMEFMKENRVSPIGGCLPIFLQIPVFFGFYQMLQSAIELRGQSFLWACDLSRADTVGVVPGLNFPINPLPLIMGATMLWQARITPPSPGMDPMQQKIMKYMPLMFIVFLYSFPAGLALYWTVQNLFTIAQTKLTKTHREKAAGTVAAPGAGIKKKK